MRRTLLPLALFLVSIAAAQQPSREALRQEAGERATAQAKLVQTITDSIFSFAELGYQEIETARYVTGMLRDNGFRVTEGVAGMPTAMATPIAHKGATAGAAAQAMTAIELFADPTLVQQAKAYFAEQTKDVKWESLIPADTAPPIHFNEDKMQRYRPQLDKLRFDTYLEQLGIQYPTIREQAR